METKPENYAEEVRSIHRLAKISIGMSAFSLFLGGVLLSAVGTICGIVSLVKANRKKTWAAGKSQSDQNIAANLFHRCVVAVVAGCIALVLNASALYYMWPQIEQVVQTGDIAQLYSTAETQTQTTTPNGSQTWG